MELSDPELWSRGEHSLGLLLDWIIYETNADRAAVLKAHDTMFAPGAHSSVLGYLEKFVAPTITDKLVKLDPNGLGKLPLFEKATGNFRTKGIFKFLKDFHVIRENPEDEWTLSPTELFHMYGALSNNRRSEGGDIMVYEPASETDTAGSRNPKLEHVRFGIPENGMDGRWLYGYVYGMPVAARHKFDRAKPDLNTVIYTMPSDIPHVHEPEEYGIAAPKRLRNWFGPNKRSLATRLVFEPVKKHIVETLGMVSRPSGRIPPTGPDLHVARLRDIWTQRFIHGVHDFKEDLGAFEALRKQSEERLAFYETHQTQMF